jgi:DnaJ-class molecular chaperone
MSHSTPSDPAGADVRRGDEAPEGAEGTGENICPHCGGSGHADGGECPECSGTGRVTEGIGGG